MSEQNYRYTMETPVSEPPNTVVSLVPSITESLFDLNLGDRLLAVTDYCVHPANGVAKLTRIGGTKTPNVQQIIDLKPGMVFANQEENRREDVEALQAAGIPVWVTFPKTVPDVFNLLWNIMYLFEETAMVERVRHIERVYDRVTNAAKTYEANPKRVFAPIWYDPWMTFNADTYVHDLLRACGGYNVFADHAHKHPLQANETPADRDIRYPRITLDEVVAAKPDVILLPSEPFAFGESHIALLADLDIPAVQNNHIHLIDGSYLTWHGTRIAYAFDTLPALLIPTE